MESFGSSSTIGHDLNCFRIPREVSPEECCETIYHTTDQHYLAICQTCPRGMALVATTKGTQAMTKGNCADCPAEGVIIYRHNGVARCWPCHEAAKKQAGAAEKPRPEPFPVSDEAEKQETEPSKLPQPDSGEEAREFSWDAFEVLRPAPRNKSAYASIEPGERIRFSAGLTVDLGWPVGQIIEVRASADRQRLAIGLASERYCKGRNYKLVSANRSLGLIANCGAPLTAVEAKRGAYAVTVTAWGVVVHLDQPVERK